MEPQYLQYLKYKNFIGPHEKNVLLAHDAAKKVKNYLQSYRHEARAMREQREKKKIVAALLVSRSTMLCIIEQKEIPVGYFLCTQIERKSPS